MRLAILVAPSDPSAGDAGARRMALAWLRGRLARFGFQIVIVGGGSELEADLQRAFDGVSPGDSVLLHLSGRLSGREAIALGDDAPDSSPSPLPLGSICGRLAARAPGHVSLIAELTHDEDPADPLAAAGCLETAVLALGARERGYLVLAAVRPTSAAPSRFRTTRCSRPCTSGPSRRPTATRWRRASRSPWYTQDRP